MILFSLLFLLETISFLICQIYISMIMLLKFFLRSIERYFPRLVRPFNTFSAINISDRPPAGGYLNEYGKINLPRLQIFFNALSEFEQNAFEKEHSDLNWFKSKQRPKEMENLKEKGVKGAQSKQCWSSLLLLTS